MINPKLQSVAGQAADNVYTLQCGLQIVIKTIHIGKRKSVKVSEIISDWQHALHPRNYLKESYWDNEITHIIKSCIALKF